MKRSMASILCAAMLALIVPAKADAHTTICDLKEALRFGYGPKVNAAIWVPRQKVDAFQASIKTFFERSGYSVSAVGSLVGPNEEPQSWNQLPQQTSRGIAFSIRSGRDRDFATVELTTFSFDCAATDDWRPYWRGFQDYLRASEFKPFLAWRPPFGEVSQMVGGDFSTPLWYVRLQAVVGPFNRLLGALLNLQ